MMSRALSVQLRLRSPIILSFLLTQTLIITASAKPLYKWTDEEGKTRYSDTLPNERAGKGFKILSSEGRVLKVQKPAKSSEQLKQERLEKRRRDREARIQAEIQARMTEMQKHHDNVLLMTFTNEGEILTAKQERMAVINSVIKLLQKNIASELQKLAREEKRAKELYTDKGLEIPGGQAQKIEYFTKKVITKQRHLSLKLEERDKVEKQYNKDLIRYRELVKQKQHEEEEKNKAKAVLESER